MSSLIMLRVLLRQEFYSQTAVKLYARRMSNDLKSASKDDRRSFTFDIKMLEFLACPLSKAPLRYSKETNELICDELQVAYPINNGIPNLIPSAGRKLDENSSPDTSSPKSTWQQDCRLLSCRALDCRAGFRGSFIYYVCTCRPSMTPRSPVCIF